MPGSPSQESLLLEGHHLVLYDGVCALCDRLLHFLIERDRRGVFSFASLQSATGAGMVERFGGNPSALTSFCVVVDYRTNHARMLIKSRAALFVASELGWPWKGAIMFRGLPTAILDSAYDVVARHRYRVFGRFEVCQIPRPEIRQRFID
jgi:predicted DCC family thiol-disulfide oxidoreductase YuxK